ncbi:hypothetical protein FS749_016111 [Ceratobasidium sp. UAMH 11750]|nr:hypothetical protein FS749_016111 [Ceratobasidium sp. UAMH 11750]
MLPSGVEVDDGLFWDFDDRAGEEVTPNAPEHSGSNRTTLNVQLRTWQERHLDSYILALYFRDAAPGDDHRCSGCDSVAASFFRCDTCLEPLSICQACVLARHKYAPLHRISVYSGSCWRPTSLKDLGLEWNLGHNGEPCCESKGTSSILVGDVFGYIQVAIRYCAHTGAPSKAIQLLRAGLFPCSDIEPQSAFTLATMDHFTLFSTLGKTSAHRYHSVLKRQTDTGFPANVPDRYRELLATQRKYALATALKRAGSLFQPSAGAVLPDSLAVHCPSCPRAGVNFHPEDVPPAERPMFRLHVAVDGNFRNPRKAKKVHPDDICFTGGRMYFVEQLSYKAWIASRKQGDTRKGVRPECDNHKAATDKFARWGGLDVTGIGACTCARHSLFLPSGMVDFDKGERRVPCQPEPWANIDYAIASAATAVLAWGLVWLAITYNIFCHWFPNFKTRVKELPANIAFDTSATDLLGGIPRWHAAGHIESCRARWSLNYLPYFGRIEGEGCERAWAHLNETAGSTSEKSPGARWDAINYIAGDWNFEKNITMTSFIVSKFKEAKRMYDQQLGVFTDLDKSLPPATTTEWRQESTAPRKEGRVWTSPFFGKNDWDRSVHRVLEEEQDREVDNQPEGDGDQADEPPEEQDDTGADSSHGKARDALAKWILKAIELENAMDKLRVDAAQLGRNSTPRQHDAINSCRTLLMAQVSAHRQERERFLGSLGVPDHPTRNQVQSADVEHSELGLPSSYEGATLIATNCLRAARVEGSVCRAACDDALRVVRNLLGAKSFTFRYKQKNLTGERATTRAESQLKALRDKVECARRRYNRCRAALLRLDLLGSDRESYPELEPDHLTLLSDYLDTESAMVGQGSRAISWIWRAETAGNDEQWMIDALKVEWFRARQRAVQWQEELMLLKREIVMTFNTFQHEQREWHTRSKQPGLSPGMSEYAARKAWFFERLASDAYSHGKAVVEDSVVSLEWVTAKWPKETPPSHTL